MRVGYTTGTFSDIHPGQIEFLKVCKGLLGPSSRLIVGLVTDELAARQKRKPSMTFMHRRAILMAFPFVDLVVRHDGDNKTVALKKLHFTDLFIGDEYSECKEYQNLPKEVTVHFIPCPMARQYSSSKLAIQRSLDNSAKLEIIKDGTAGLVYMYRDSPLSVIIKTIRVSHEEVEAEPTVNVYGLPVPSPRNFKFVGDPHRFPNLPGVNAFREIEVQQLIQQRSWCPTISVDQVYECPESLSHEPQEDWSHISQDKVDARQIYFVRQKFVGDNLDQWISHHEAYDGFQDHFMTIIRELHHIVYDELRELKLVHGDIHADNICVREVSQSGASPIIPQEFQGSERANDMEVYLIDWGWCLHSSFTMEEHERRYYEFCLRHHWDWGHFLSSLKYSYGHRPWFATLRQEVESNFPHASFDFDPSQTQSDPHVL